MIYGYFRAGAAGRMGEKSHEQSVKGGVLAIARHFCATSRRQKWSYDAKIGICVAGSGEIP